MAALEELVQTWKRPLFYYIRRLIDNEDDARQVLQQSWVGVVQGLDKRREPRKLPAWLYGITRMTALTHLRARYGERAITRNEEVVTAADVPEAQLDFDNAEQIHYGLGRLSLIHREALTLFFLQDLSSEEVAELLEVPVGTVAALLYRLFAIFGFLVCVAWVALMRWAASSGVLRRAHRPWVVATTMTMGFIYLALLVFVFVLPIAHEESITTLGT